VSAEKFDLNDDNSYRLVRETAERLIQNPNQVEDGLITSLARFLADSKTRLQEHKNKVLRVAILMNLVHEQNRLRPSSRENPNGENSLENKLKQLDWLFDGTAVDYKLIYVSGTCPWGSDAVLDKEIRRLGTDRVIHLRLEDSVTPDTLLPNRKGGEMIFGMRAVAQLSGYPDPGYFDCLLFTDADMTFDMGQMGFLIDRYYRGDHVITGNRMASGSVLIKNMTRAGTGILMFRHIQRKLAPLFFRDMDLHDTQCPWKFFSRRALEDIAPDLDSDDWSIDTDILSSAHTRGYPIAVVPVTAVDSEMESHGKALGHYVRNRTIIEGTLHQARKYGLPYDREIASLVERYLKTDEDYRILMESGMPDSLKHLPNGEWGRSAQITIEIVEQWFRRIMKR
jgi:hypothetical protein